MNSYVVHTILQHGTRKLLLVQPNSYEHSICVYDEHTGTTLMRLTDCTISEFKRAIELLASQSASPNQS